MTWIFFGFRGFPVDYLEELQPFGVSVTRLAETDHRAGHDIECRE